jgi:hypothetical protein
MTETTRAPLLTMTEDHLRDVTTYLFSQHHAGLTRELTAELDAQRTALQRERERAERLELELADWKGRAERQYDENVARIAAQGAAEQDAARLRAALREYVEWCGAVHEADCPADDTCECAGAPVNSAVNAALTPPAPTTAQEPE